MIGFLDSPSHHWFRNKFDKLHKKKLEAIKTTPTNRIDNKYPVTRKHGITMRDLHKEGMELNEI